MAFGIKPHFEANLRSEVANETQLLLLALEAAQQFGWQIENVTHEGATIYTPMSFWSYGEQLSLKIDPAHPGMISIKSACTSSQLFDYGKNRKNIRKLGNEIKKYLNTYTKEELEEKVKNMVQSIDELEKEKEAYTALPDEKRSFFSFFIPRKNFMAIPILLDMNILVFVLMFACNIDIFEPDILDLLNWGADFGQLTLTGDWWRTLTCNFVHVGIFHLLMNMYALLYIGLFLESLIGMRRTLIAYLLTGMCSAAASLWVNPEIVSAGASGAIFGLYGIFFAYLLLKRIEPGLRNSLLVSIGIFIVYNLLDGFSKSGIDNAAHIGGLVSGFVLGLLYIVGDKRKEAKQRNIIYYMAELLFLIIFVLVLADLSRNVSSDSREFRSIWNSGLLQKYWSGQIGEEEFSRLLEEEQTAKPAE